LGRKILHLFSNWKWTGPAEHALATATYLFKRAYDVSFACAHPPVEVEDSLVQRARKTSMPLVNGLYLNKHLNILQNARDVLRLTKLINTVKYDLIHTHLPNDHIIAGIASKLASHKATLIRTVYDGTGVTPGLRNRLLLSFTTDGLITVSDISKRSIQKEFGLSPEKIWHISPGVDCERFSPSIDGRKVRSKYAVDMDAPLVGIVARVQPHRRFDIFLKAVKMLLPEIPRLKVFIIGRGTHIQEVAIKPAQEMGLSEAICFTGYQLYGYPEMLAALDLKVFLVPGSDGSCRAVREAMAMGKPVVVANRGMLPEIVDDGVNGLVVDDTPENLARSISLLIKDKELRNKMGAAARKKMNEESNLIHQQEKIKEFYRQTFSNQM
jgi:glycosyltransferase involved in cell wall biosynthesis